MDTQMPAPVAAEQSLLTQARAALSDRKGLDKTPAYWAARLLHELAKPLEQLKVAEVRRLAKVLFEPLTEEVGWDA